MTTEMETFILNKSVGPFSAGTRVDIISDAPGAHEVVGRISVPDKNSEYGKARLRTEFVSLHPLDESYLTKCRSMTRIVPSVNSRERRKAKRTARKNLANLTGGKTV